MTTSKSDGGSLAGKGKAKRKPKPTSKATHRKKKIKARYSKAREEAQLAGVIPTTPDGAVRPEQVNPVLQGDGASVLLPKLALQAIREGWATLPAEAAEVVQELISVVRNPDYKVKDRISAANALRLMDQMQWERDHPEEAAKAKGGNVKVGVSVGVQNNIRNGDVFSDIEAIESSIRRILEEQTDATSVSSIRADGDAQSVDEAQSGPSAS